MMMTTDTVTRICTDRAEWDAERDHQLAYDWPGVDTLLVQIEEPNGSRTYEVYECSDRGHRRTYQGKDFPEAVFRFW